MTVTDQTVDVCNELLRGELSAMDTYTQAMSKFQTIPEDAVLRRIRKEHGESADQLRQLVTENGGEPSLDSGVWGGLVRALEGAAGLFGETPALKLLEEGEEHGIREYQTALADPDVSEDAKTVIRQHLLPRLTEHVDELRSLRRP